MPTSAQKKKTVVFAVLKEGRSVTDVARELGVARKTIYSWLKRYKEAAPRAKEKTFETAYSSGKDHPRAYGYKIKKLLIKEVVDNPQCSATSLSKKLKVGRHAVVNLLSELDLSTKQDREGFARLYGAPGRLHTDIKLSAVRAILEGKPVSEVSRENGVARKTVYEWLKRYRQEGKVVEKYVSGFEHPKSFSANQEKFILQRVVKSPELSIHRLAKTTGFSSHGIYNVLKRHGLTYKEARLAYAASQQGISRLPILSRFLDRVRYVLEQFIPSLAPAPPPERRQIFFRVLKIFGASVLTSFLFGFGTLSWFRIVSQATSFSNAIGLIFASLALLMGTFFFLYSFKYYITLALVLSFSQQEGVGGVREGGGKGRGRNFLSWILGLANGNGSTSPGAADGKAVGLTPNLEHIRLKRKPYVSIHIPFYNEKNVVERSIAAATNFDYPEYEVILCDDSTDETTTIIREYQKKHLVKGERLKTIKNKEQGWELTEIEVRPGVTLKHLHRTSRSGFKGGALKLALTLVNPKCEFISVFDADFVPYPDTLELFLKYFQTTAGTLDFKSNKHQKQQRSNIAAVQGYQWHVLNKSENWITRGVRAEYAGSYVIERSGTEIYSGLKQISGAVYMVRRDVLEEIGWETSITEDFQLTLKLYEKGYKIVFTPYVQAPAECVSTLKRLIRQRMRWAEGHSQNIKKMFFKLLLNPKLTTSEKLEFLYLSPYYLQAFFFLVGTISWLISETLFPARLPFWTSLWGWSLVLTNMLSLPLMNAVGLFLEESEEKDYSGLASFVALSYILVSFQAYAAIKGFLQKEEGPWFRTPKTGKITDIFTRGKFYRFISGILPGRSQVTPAHAMVNKSLLARQSLNHYLALSTVNNRSSLLNLRSGRRRRKTRRVVLVGLLISALLLNYVSFFTPQEAYAQASNPTIEQQINIIDQQYSRIWYSPTWTKRQPITLVNETSTLTNYQVKLNISYDNDMQGDFEDLRFTNTSGTLLDYWLEKKTDSTSAIVWVEVDSLAANADTTIYMYYDNDSVASASSGPNTFEMFDDFNDGNYNGWTVSSGTWSVNGGALEISSTGHNFITFDSFSGSDYIVETLMRITTTISGDQQPWVVGRFSSTSSFYAYGYRGAKWELWRPWTSLASHSPQTMTQNTWYKQVLLMKGSTLRAKSWTASGTDPGWQIIYKDTYHTSGKVGFKGSWAAATIQYDDVFARKFAETEPTSSFGTEETFSGYTAFAPTNNSLGIFSFDPDKYNGETVYFETIYSVDGSAWTKSRSSTLSMPLTAADFTVRLQIGDNSSQLPAVELYNISDTSSLSTLTFGAASNTKAYLRAGRLIIVQGDPSAITDTVTMIEVGDSETLTSAADIPVTDKKIYRWDPSRYSETVTVKLEAVARAGWQNRRKITFNNSASAEDLDNFPVLVKLSSPDRIDYSKTQNAGQDIRFVDADGVTELAYEIESWDEAGTSYIWVNVPNIPSGSTTDYIWMYYNNTDAQDAQDRASVWNSGYKLVHHFNESGTTDIDDSTSNSNFGTKKSLNEPNTISTGQIDGAQDFDGTDDKIISLVPEHSPYTLETWVKLDAVANKNITVRTSGIPTSAWSSTLRTTTDKFEHKLYAGLSRSVVGTTTVSTGTWYYVAGTAANNSNMYLYVNGASEGTPLSVGTIWTGGDQYHTGSNSGDSKGYFDGVIDELRISNVVRSGEWIEASHKAMNDTFISSFENEESVGTGYVSLYTNATNCSSQAAESEVSIATTSWTRVRSSDIKSNLSTGTDYMVCAENAILANAKIIVTQSNAGGITDMELYHSYINTVTTDTDSTYSDQGFINEYNPENFDAGTFTYYFEATLKTSAGTSYAKLKDMDTPDEIDNPTTSEVSSTSTSYERKRSSALGDNTDWPSSAKDMDTIIKNSAASGNTTSVASSWLIIQVSNLQVPENLLLILPFALFIPKIFAKKGFGIPVFNFGLYKPAELRRRKKRQNSKYRNKMIDDR